MINLDDPKRCRITKTPDYKHYEISVKCPFCGEWNSVIVESQQLFQMRVTGSANCLIKTHNADERELLVSGVCSKCF